MKFFFQIDITWNYIWSNISVLDHPKFCFPVICAKKCSPAKITWEMISEAILIWNVEEPYKNDNINVKNVQMNMVDKLFYKYISKVIEKDWQIWKTIVQIQLQIIMPTKRSNWKSKKNPWMMMRYWSNKNLLIIDEYGWYLYWLKYDYCRYSLLIKKPHKNIHTWFSPMSIFAVHHNISMASKRDPANYTCIRSSCRTKNKW